MNKLASEKQTRVIAALTEGCSVRATERLTDVNETEVGEDLGDDGRVFDGGEEAEATAAAGTREDVDGENSPHQVGPRPGTAGPLGCRRRS